MKKIFLVLIPVLIFIAGCATTGSLDRTYKKAPDRVKEDIINYSFKEVYDAAKMAILNLGLALDSEGKDDNTTILYAKSTANLLISARVRFWRVSSWVFGTRTVL